MFKGVESVRDRERFLARVTSSTDCELVIKLFVTVDHEIEVLCVNEAPLPEVLWSPIVIKPTILSAPNIKRYCL